MYGTTVFSLFIGAAICAADKPIQKPQSTAWLWAEVATRTDPECRGPYCQATTWLWAEAIDATVKESLPVGCHCGPDCGCGKGGQCKCTQQECYEKLRAKAIREKKPLCVGVGCEPARVEGILSCRYDKYPGVKSGLVVGFTIGNELFSYDPLPCGATKDQIKAAAQVKATPPVVDKH